MAAPATDENVELRSRIARLEAREACVSSFNEYLHHLDAVYTDELLAVFAADAHLDVVNFPPGSGRNLAFDGRDAIRKLYEKVPAGISRHHSANVTVAVRPDAQEAELSAYFITSSAYGFGGGLYQGTLAPADGRWCFTRLRIVSTWGWVLPQETPPYLSEHLGLGALRDGRPVVYRPPGSS
jgi:hypothetical protein